jgi:hypothetical protein
VQQGNVSGAFDAYTWTMNNEFTNHQSDICASTDKRGIGSAGILQRMLIRATNRES